MSAVGATQSQSYFVLEMTSREGIRMKNQRMQLRGRSRPKILAVAMAASVIMAVGPIAATTASAKVKSNGQPVTVGVISSQNGLAPTTDIPRYNAFVATVNWANLHGGVNGHQINLVTQLDASNQIQNLTAAQSLVETRGAVVVCEMSSAMAGAAQWLSSNGVPVVAYTAISVVVSQYRTFFAPNGGYNTNPTLWNTNAALFFKK